MKELFLMGAKTNRELLELIANQVNILTNDVSGLKNDVSGLKNDVSGLKNDVSELKYDVSEMKSDMSELKKGQIKLEREVENIKGIVVRMEINFSEKLGALLNGYVQNAARLDRVETLMAKHDLI
jgi:archaellum component FlaC